MDQLCFATVKLTFVILQILKPLVLTSSVLLCFLIPGDVGFSSFFKSFNALSKPTNISFKAAKYNSAARTNLYRNYHSTSLYIAMFKLFKQSSGVNLIKRLGAYLGA